MFDLCKENLIEIKDLLVRLNNDQYTYKSKILSGTSIGQHIRHILEFYLCLINGRKTGTVNYDLRERNHEVENDSSFAIKIIDGVLNNLSHSKNDRKIALEGNYSLEGRKSERINSSYIRELTYNLEHSIHHQALIKVSLKEQGIEQLINENFGVAPATIKFRKSCAQ